MAWAPDYATVAELRTYLRIGDSDDDTVLGYAVASASRAVDQATGRQFGLIDEPEARYFAPRWDPRGRRWTVPVDDLMTADGLVVDVDLESDQSYSSSLTDYFLTPQSAVAKGQPWTVLVLGRASTVQPTDPLTDQVRVTARWGWASVPAAVKQATLLQASRLVSRRDSPYGVAGSPEMGSEVRLLARLDPDVEVTLRPYRRVWGAA